MIKVTTNAEEVSVKLGQWVSKVGTAGRHLLYSAAANAVAILVRGHLSRLGTWKHMSAEKLGAQPTGFLQKAARGTVFNSSENGGEVIIPAPLGRAFHDVEIRPKVAAALTIPAAAESYGKRVSVLEAHGWKIFRPKDKTGSKDKGYLMGARDGEDPKLLYWIRTSARQEQDRELLPSDDELKTTAAAAMVAVIRRAAG